MAITLTQPKADIESIFQCSSAYWRRQVSHSERLRLLIYIVRPDM